VLENNRDIQLKFVNEAPPPFSGTLRIQPFLLNRGDSFIIEIILSNYDGKTIRPSARITGLYNVDRQIDSFIRPQLLWWAYAILVLIGAFLIVISKILTFPDAYSYSLANPMPYLSDRTNILSIAFLFIELTLVLPVIFGLERLVYAIRWSINRLRSRDKQ